MISRSADPKPVKTSATSMLAPSAVGVKGEALTSAPVVPVSVMVMFEGSMSQVPVLPFAAVVSTEPLMFMDL